LVGGRIEAEALFSVLLVQAENECDAIYLRSIMAGAKLAFEAVDWWTGFGEVESLS
jgi:hypothetical protein